MPHPLTGIICIAIKTSLKIDNSIAYLRKRSTLLLKVLIGVYKLTLKGQCKPHGLGIVLGESCSKLLLHCTKWDF